MCVKTCFIILFLCIFLHARNEQSSVLASRIYRKKLQPHKINEEKLKFNKLISRNGRVTFEYSMPSRSAEADLCRKKNANIKAEAKPILAGSSTADCMASLDKKALQHVMISKGSRWPHLNVKEMESHATIYREEDLSETDYQPPHRKSPIHNK